MHAFEQLKQDNQRAINETEKILIELKTIARYTPEQPEFVKVFLKTLEVVMTLQISNAKSEILILSATSQVFEQAFKDIDILKQAVQTLNIKDQSVSKKVDNIHSLTEKYENTFGDLTEIIRIKKAELKEKEKFDREYREANK